MNIIVTGYSGFVGTNFVKSSKEYNIVKVDLLTRKVNEIDFSGIDSVLHLAALVHQMKGAPEEQYFKINRDLAFEVALAAKKQGIKYFVLMSTSGVYGELTTGTGLWNEDSECHPLDPYGRSKFEAEKLIMDLQDDHFKAAIVRSPLVYGAGVKANMYKLLKLVDRFSLLPLGGINNRRSIVYVGNLVALLQHIIKTRASGIFIAGDRDPISTTELICLIAKGFPKTIYLFSIPGFVRKLIAKLKPSIADRIFGSLELDNSGTNQKLGFSPPFTTEDSIRKMVEWYCKR
jgi:nucleoside-diphosphate-sugar epimerase